MGSATAAMEWPASGSFFGSPTVSNEAGGYAVHGGSYSMRVDAPTSGVAQGCIHTFATANQTAAIARAYISPGADGVAVNAKSTVAALYSIALVPIVWIALDATNIYFESEDETLLTVSGGAFIGEVWQGFEILFARVDGAGADFVIFRSIGPHESLSPLFVFSGKSFSAGVAAFAVGVNLQAETATAGRFYFDDIAINDGSGSAQNGFPGPGKVSMLTVNADGDMDNDGTQGTDWESVSAPGQTAFSQVDETPTPDDDTSAIDLMTDSSGATDAPVLDFNCVSSATAGIPANARITCVQVGARNRAISAAAASFVLRVKSDTGGTVAESATTAVATTSYTTHKEAAPRNYLLTSYENPSVSGQPWTPTLLDTLQIGIRTPDATPDVRCTALWAMVDWTTDGNYPRNTINRRVLWTRRGR